LGRGDDLVGVTFECDHPPEARSRRIVSTSTLPEGLSPPEIDAIVSARVAAGEGLYRLDEGALAELGADVVLTQDLCAVCAVDVSVVDDALAYLGCRAEVLTIDPHTLDDVFASIVTLGRATGHVPEAEALVSSLQLRLSAVRARVDGLARPRVMLLEWTDPPYGPGHWVPEMIAAAGGVCLLGEPGARSERVLWESVHEASPDVVVAAPCGYDLAGAQRLADELVASGVLPTGVPVHAVDANAAWARPGTRLVNGVEELAAILHPGA